MAEIALEQLSKIYGDGTHAVSDLNLHVADGEFVVLVGPSGCGKTTALRMVAGLEEITGGTVRIGERIVNKLPPKDRDLAMVFQNYALYPHMSAYDNIAFGLKMRRFPKSEIRRRAAARRDGARDRARAAGVPDGRAAVEPRREAARRDARRDRSHPARPESDDDLCDARPDRGDDARRPRGGDA